jgi:transmembrane sensor
VLLEGEAYLDVVHDTARPFRVRARNAVIRDIGTRFAVRAYATDSTVRVVVTHGRVRVHAVTAPPGSGSIVDSGMLGLIDADGATSLRRHADTAMYNAFVRGQMRFVRTPLRSVIGELARWYDVDIRLADRTLGDRLITATLDNQTLPDLLIQFSVALNLHATRTGRTVVLRGD